MAMQRKTNVRLPPEVNRILYVRNLPYKITAEEMYDIFGKYGAIRQIRVGNTPETRGTAFVVYEDIFDAKNACDHLSGFNVCNRYLVVLYYQSNKAFKKVDTDKKQEEIDKVKKRFGVLKELPGSSGWLHVMACEHAIMQMAVRLYIINNEFNETYIKFGSYYNKTMVS
ncbi:splicing factor 3B subunit 6 [Nephila pilipes]|uniref:Splicing factor 3B subunit 6 n=1 Tax=Nephila pilipes TaxID=299642 RepID=A0A8X6QTF3_NEPPI|nr:splicing factor 3B subunit 6 [Nephila pilipes]